MRIFKKILGVIAAAQVIPVLLMCVNFVFGSKDSYYIVYMMGFVTSVTFIIIIGLVILAFWLFDDWECFIMGSSKVFKITD